MKFGWAVFFASTVSINENACIAARSRFSDASAYHPIQTTSGWQMARADFASLRKALQPSTRLTFQIRATFDAPLWGPPLVAQGVYAVQPPATLRLQLVGSLGTIVLDVWLQGEAFRWAAPVLGRIERGSSLVALPPGHPVRFLRWWMLQPLAGTLLHSAMTSSGRFLHTVRAADGALLTVRTGVILTVQRRVQGQSEWLMSDRQICGHIRYYRSGPPVDLTIQCLGMNAHASARAFADPDQPPPPLVEPPERF